MRTLLWMVAIAMAVPACALAETSRETAARLAVDVVVLKGGRELRGSLIERRAGNGLTIAVRREWLRSRFPDWLAELDAAAQAEHRTALETLITRAREWLADRADDRKLVAVVRPELERLEQRLVGNPPPVAAETESEFLLVDVRGEQVRRVFAQPPERRQLALVAWRDRLDNVEFASIDKLQTAVTAKQVDWRTASVDLSDRLPATAADGEREWAARTAIFEYSYREQLEFQGTGNLIVRTGDSATVPSALVLLGGVLERGGLGFELAGLLDGGLGTPANGISQRSWLESAAAVADSEHIRGFRVTRSGQDIANRIVSVETRFVARMPDGTWETVWSSAATVDASQERKEAEARIRQDPQIAESLKLLDGLGLGGQLETAVRFGAATQAALQLADARFFEFIDRYHLRLDGPILKWTSEQ